MIFGLHLQPNMLKTCYLYYFQIVILSFTKFYFKLENLYLQHQLQNLLQFSLNVDTFDDAKSNDQSNGESM